MKKLLTLAAVALLLSACQTPKVDPAVQAEMDCCASMKSKDGKECGCCKDGVMKKDLTGKEAKKCQQKMKQCAAKAKHAADAAKAPAKKAKKAKAAATDAKKADAKADAKDAKPAEKK